MDTTNKNTNWIRVVEDEYKKEDKDLIQVCEVADGEW
jgi:hypothetical protein